VGFGFALAVSEEEHASSNSHPRNMTEEEVP